MGGLKIHVSMIVRNEADNYLEHSLRSAFRFAGQFGGQVFVTDDASDDDGKTVAMLVDSGAFVRRLFEPEYWDSESAARQRHLEWVGAHIDVGDWIFGLDADELINDISDVESRLALTDRSVILSKIFEVWNLDPIMYRVDGEWSSAYISRLYRWNGDYEMEDAEMAGGSEPAWVKEANRNRRNFFIPDIHLMHLGYAKDSDRKRKQKMYLDRIGGHGHENKHIMSITEEPTLNPYPHIVKDLV